MAGASWKRLRQSEIKLALPALSKRRRHLRSTIGLSFMLGPALVPRQDLRPGLTRQFLNTNFQRAVHTPGRHRAPSISRNLEHRHVNPPVCYASRHVNMISHATPTPPLSG
jgi:hypothetical protein